MPDDLNLEPTQPTGSSPPPPSIIIPAAPKKPPIKIILTSIVVFLLLASIPAAVFLVQQRQEIREKAAGECGNRSVGECWGECRGTDEGEVCCAGPSQWSEWRITRANSPSCGGGGGEPEKCDGKQVGDTWPECKGCDEGVVTCKGRNNYDWTLVKANSANCGPSCGGGKEPEKCDNDKQVGDSWPECKGCTEGVVVCKGGINYDWTPVKENSPNCPGCGVTPQPGGTCRSDLGTCLASCQAGNPYTNCRWDGQQVKCDCQCSEADIQAGRCPSGVWTTVVCGDPCVAEEAPAPTAQCRLIKAYDTSWNLLDTSKLSQLKTGDKVRFAVLGQTSHEKAFDKARFRVNSTTWLPETTSKKPGTEEFYLEYTLPQGVINFRVEAQVHHPTLGWQ